MSTMSTTAAKLDPTTALSDELRDGILQDLLAVGMILHRMECTPVEAGQSDLATASATIEENVRIVRDLIDRLRAA